ncbi:MAG: TetR/AcrR family transcriptional regulator [Treponema sp.]|jgi:AcrR family transcriptional regulator|nr:TetR/AcrR family transcriptional regulator [Treponema sp.]
MTRADIVQAAFRAWGRAFYKNTSLSGVAKELGVSKPALYRHFCGKQALLEAMYESFFDDYAAFVKATYEQASKTTGYKEAMAAIARIMMDFYARNVYAFIFSLVYVYGDRRMGNTEEQLVKRGVDMSVFYRMEGELKAFPPLVIHGAIATLTFSMARFHKLGQPGGTINQGFPGEPVQALSPSEAAIEAEISLVDCIISNGIGFQKQEIEDLDYGALEQQVSGTGIHIEENKLLHSVAEAVAGAGPWDVSMGMVAHRSGLSKSGLYAHFKNKHDMLAQLFVTEMDRIIDFAEESMKGSTVAAERLYLAIFSICDYLRSRPDILIALDWLRTRNVSMEQTGQAVISPPPRIYRIFRDIHFSPELKPRLPDTAEDAVPAWILFLIVNALMHGGRGAPEHFMNWTKPPKRQASREDFGKISNENFRILYRFITRGIREFAL